MRPANSVALLIAACAVAGCRPSVAEVASQDFGCPEDRIITEVVSDHVESAAGCDRKNVYKFSLYRGEWHSPLERAAFELSCPKEQVVVVPLGKTEVGVEGCGRRLVYVLTDDKWVLNSDSHAAEPSSAPAE